MKINLIILITFITISSYAQDYKFGKVSKEELEEKYYPLDSTESAAYLYKYRKTYFQFNSNFVFRLITDVRERIKIYNKEGFDKATKLISYYTPKHGTRENIRTIEGYTYYLENEKIVKKKIEKTSIFDERKSDIYSIKKITFPNIQEGVVIELKYTLTSVYYNYIDDINYQFEIPVKSYKCIIEIPNIYTYNKNQKGYYTVTHIPSSASYKSLGIKKYIDTYEAKDIPALKEKEPFVGNINNYRGGITYELAKTNFINFGGGIKYYTYNWEDVSKNIYKSSKFGEELEKSNYYKKDLSPILKVATTDLQKVGVILQLIKSKVKWNGKLGKYTEKGVKKAYEESVGNVADINLMLTSMLRFAGLNANPVLVSTKDNGIPNYPTYKGFNYVVSMVEFPDNTYFLLDATEPYSIPNILPFRALNWKGRKVTKNGDSEWIRMITSKKIVENELFVKITNDLIMEGFHRTLYKSNAALNIRKIYNNLKEEDIISEIEDDYEIEIDKFKIGNQYDGNKPVTRSIQFSSNNLIEELNGKLYIEPLLFLTKHKNPFKSKERNFPIDFTTPWQRKNTVSIQIPEGYKVESIPETLAIGLPDQIGFFKYQITQNNNTLKIIYLLEFDKYFIAPEYYKSLKDFYSKVIDKQTEKIVLIKE